MGDFVLSTFIQDHQLGLVKREVPLTCSTFDGSLSTGGLITHKWGGTMCIQGDDNSHFACPVELNATKIGNHDVILGIPWLRSHDAFVGGATSSLLINGPSKDARFSKGDVSSPPPSSPPVPCYSSSSFSSPSVSASAPPSDLPATLPQSLQEFADVFQPQDSSLPLFRPGYDLEVHLKPGCVPPSSRFFVFSPDKEAELRSYIEEQLAKGNIRKSSSPAVSPIFFVKSEGKANRPCVDYRGLNSITVRDKYPIPVIDMLLLSLKKKKRYSKIDLKSAFNLLRVARGHEWKTAFRTPWGLFEYLVMPFGLANAPACFQRFITSILSEFLGVFCFVYIDDILIFSETEDEHEGHIRLVLSKLRAHGLYASVNKCLFCQDSVPFLGFIISSEGMTMDPGKLATIRDWPLPRNVRELRRFLGFANFYRRFIHRFSDIAAPLTSLTKEGVHVEAGLQLPDVVKSFHDLKIAFTTAPFLLHFDFNKTCVIQVDSSGYALSAILSQPDDAGQLRVRAYYSRKLTPAEMLWQVHDQELGAMVAAFVEWRAWVVGTNSPVIVFSDHANLRYFMTAQHLTPRQARWASYLSSFYFHILHTPGKLNPADPASRRPDYTDVDRAPSYLTLLHLVKKGGGPEVLSLSTSVSSIDVSFSLPSPSSRALLTEAYSSEKEFLATAPSPLYHFRGGLWWFRDRLYVPASLRLRVLTAFHDSPTVGHPGTARMLSIITRTFAWGTVRQDVIAFCRSCDSCQRTRISTKAKAGELVPLPIPDCPWSVIGIDLIVKLPPSFSSAGSDPQSASTFDSILVITDHLSKGAHFIKCNESMDSAALARVFIDRFYRYHGLPDKIVSDRGATFVSAFWKALSQALQMQLAPSTAYHPQTDGQTERTNQTLETYLCHFVSFRQDDWVDWLSMAEFSFNNAVSTSTHLTPFFAWQGFHPRANIFTAPSKVPSADQFVALLEDIQLLLTSSLRRAKEYQAKQYNKRASPAHVFGPGDLVWLTRRFIPSLRPSNKLDFRRIGPFPIKRMVGTNTALLDLGSAFSRLHPVFNISLLTPYVDPTVIGRTSSTSPARTTDTSTIPVQGWQAVTAILDFRTRGKRHPEYLLRWLHGGPSDDTWVPLSDISGSLDPYLWAFHKRYPRFQVPQLLHNKNSRPHAGFFASMN